MTIVFLQLSLVEKAETVQVHFTLEGERPRSPNKITMDEKSTWILTMANLSEVGLTQTPRYHVSGFQPWDENQGPLTKNTL